MSFQDYPLGDISGGAAGANSQGGAGGPSVLPGGGSLSGGGDSTADAGAGLGDGGTDTGGSSTLLGSGLIDDFEDGDDQISPLEGRSGGWYAGNDGQGMQTPRSDQRLEPSVLEPPRAGSTRAAHTFGGPFQVWGALIGASLGYAAGQAAPHDISKYRGVRLWLRSGSNSGMQAKSVRLNLPTAATNPGGGCTSCNDHFGVDIPLSSSWQLVEVPFSSLKQLGFGVPKLPAFDAKRVVSLQLAFPKGVSFDLWVDDVSLY